MSLFKARDWWTVHCGADEEFDEGCLCVANIDNDPDGSDKLVTGSFAGMLRIYLPHGRDFKNEDRLLEIELPQAILQLEAGQFSISGECALAVLHPRALVVYKVDCTGDSYLELRKQFEHYLEHTAANMVCGAFGGAQGVDCICVQSYDGQLSFFERQALMFCRFLPQFLVPGPLAYLPQTDSFITCNAAFELESYKYQVLAAAAPDKQAEGGAQAGMSSSKKLHADWRTVIGEAAVSIKIARYTDNLPDDEADIVVVGEHTLFAITQRGEFKLQKRLEYHPAAAIAYDVAQTNSDGVGNNTQNLIIATHTGSLLVYHGAQLMWAASAAVVPVALRVAAFGGIKGMVVTLSDSGALTVNYMGTDPATSIVALNDAREVDYEAVEKEHRQLQSLIRTASTSPHAVHAPTHVMLRTQVPTVLDSSMTSQQDGSIAIAAGKRGEKCRSVTVRLFVSYNGPGMLQELVITAKPPPPIACSPEAVTLTGISSQASTPRIVELTFSVRSDSLPTINALTVVASYMTAGNEPRNAAVDVALPMCLFCEIVPPLKTAEYKITLDTNRPPPPLNTLFEDVISQSTLQSDILALGQQSAHVLSFRYASSHEVTVLVSKNAGRYRIQSDTFEAMWLIVHELASRLSMYFRSATPAAEEPFAIAFEENVPMEDYCEVINEHFNARQHLKETCKLLEDRAAQFRAVQKRLLVRFKERNPVPLTQLEMLMEDTWQDLADMADKASSEQQQLTSAAMQLSAATQLVLMLLRFKFKLTEESFAVLKAHLSPEIIDGDDVGWEEATEAALTSLLRTVLAKSSKERAAVAPPLAPTSSTEKLQKHLAIVLDRLGKKGTLVETNAGALSVT